MHIHKWSAWSEPYWPAYPNTPGVAAYYKQTRHCIKCNRVHIKNIKCGPSSW